MAKFVLVLLLILYFVGVIQIPWLTIPNILLATVNGQPITLLTILIGALILWAIGVLPSPLRQIAMVLFVLWVLGQIGFIAITGLTHIVVLAIVLGLIISFFL